MFIEGSGIEPGVIDTKEDVSEKLISGFTSSEHCEKFCAFTLYKSIYTSQPK